MPHGDYSKYPEYYLWRNARQRSRRKRLPFDIEPSDIRIPETCPVLGIPIYHGESKSKSNSPSIDRIVPELGYVKGNIIVVSMKANMIKSNATTEEIGKVFAFYRSLETNRDDNEHDNLGIYSAPNLYHIVRSIGCDGVQIKKKRVA